MFYISVSDAINVRLYLQTWQRKKTILNRLAFKKLNFLYPYSNSHFFYYLVVAWVFSHLGGGAGCSAISNKNAETL